MSGLAGLFNVPNTPEQNEVWSFVHMAHHRDIILAIFIQNGIALPEYILDPINPNDFEAWSYQHQAMHNQMDTILGIDGFDLTDVDWKDDGQRAGFVYLNSQEHYQASDILEIG